MTKQDKKQALVKSLGYLMTVKDGVYNLERPKGKPIGQFLIFDAMLDVAIKHSKN